MSVHANWLHLNTHWVASDSRGPICPNPEDWTEVEPSAEDQAFPSCSRL